MLEDALQPLADESNRAFLIRLLPTVEEDTILGVRTPDLRQFAREMPHPEEFLRELPHKTFEENQIHSFLLAKDRDFDRALAKVEAFLPFVDNWATCDQLRLPVFRRNSQRLLPSIRRWLQSEHPYTVRFAMENLMLCFLDENFSPEYPRWVAEAVREDYYVQMMQAWYFAEALVRQWESILPWFREERLPRWVHNKAIQKARESRRLSDSRKAALEKMKRR